MKNIRTTKDILFSYYEAKINADFPEIGLPKIRKLADSLADIAVTQVNSGAKAFQKLYADVSHKNEQHKAHFREHIELITKNTNALMQRLFENSLVIKSIDKKSGKTVLKANSLFAKELVLFLEKLDESVQKFYVEVYEIKDAEEAKEHGFQQNTLF